MEDLSWTEDRVERLRALAAENYSCSQIGGVLGVSRNAIMGKMHRLGITNANTRGPRPPGNHGHIRQTRAGKPIIVRPRRPRVSKTPNLFPQLPFTDLPDEAIPLDQRKTIVELDNSTCRWPIGDPGSPEFFFCGAIEANNAAGIPYCRAHTLRACAKTVAPSIAPRRAA